VSLERRLAEVAGLVQDGFDREFSRLSERPLLEPMRYATRGGKRLRAFLVMEGAKLHGVARGRSIYPAMAIEAMHAYSLVHDDLPCMDDDDLRHGQPTVHVKWDEATAVLVGDALQAMAYDLIARPETGDPKVIYSLVANLARATGINGMVLGQALDIAAETFETPLSLQEVRDLQACKTGALIEWAACAGPWMAFADWDPLRRYGQLLGLAFQIADDILDIEGDSEVAGKRLQKDEAAGKVTFVSHLGLDGAKAEARKIVAEAEAALDVYGDRAETLRQAARFVISRQM